ncbi:MULTISPECIES: hypothetical protein [Nocardioides]|uniref:Uncharacterized protein n=1 Tax=Nocardioides vastitatis TaxID=2568655 RepID=A0ABW0ZL95_9ACTN|nr:hypothetical protein [Nocardioides sp.]
MQHQQKTSTCANVRVLAASLVPLALLGAVVTTSSQDAGATGQRPAPPPADTIVLIKGDAANGFGIKTYDGRWRYPPTDSEALAECGEYDTRIARVRCRVRVRTWYRDLAATQKTIRYYRGLVQARTQAARTSK